MVKGLTAGTRVLSNSRETDYSGETRSCPCHTFQRIGCSAATTGLTLRCFCPAPSLCESIPNKPHCPCCADNTIAPVPSPKRIHVATDTDSQLCGHLIMYKICHQRLDVHASRNSTLTSIPPVCVPGQSICPYYDNVSVQACSDIGCRRHECNDKAAARCRDVIRCGILGPYDTLHLRENSIT